MANFNIAMIDEAASLASEPIAVLQIEAHPYLDQTKVIAAARRHGMAVVGYCPLARGKVPGDETLQRIGRAHGKSASQVALRFLEQEKIIPIPRTSKRERLAENLGSLDFKAERRGDEGDRQFEASQFAHRQSAAGAAMGLKRKIDLKQHA